MPEVAKVILQSIDQDLIALPGPDRDPPAKPLRVENGHQGPEAVGVAVVGRGREEELVLELRRELHDAPGNCEVIA